MAPYTVPTYEAPSVLSMLHSSPRVKGTNEITFDGFNNGLSLDSAAGQYLTGVSVGAAVMWVMFFVWLIILATAGCCRRKCCGNKTAGLIFLVFMVFSCFGWFYSIGANVQATNGVDRLFAESKALMKYFDTTTQNSRNVVTYMDEFDTVSKVAKATCEPILNLTGSTFPDVDLLSGVSEINGTIEDVATQLESINSSIDDVVNTAEPYMTKYKLAFVILVSCIIALSGIFALSTIFRVFKDAPGKDSGCITGISKVSGGCFLSFGVLLLFLIWALIGIMSVITTVGADICVPNPTTNLNSVFSDVTADQRSPGVELCDAEPYSYFCYFQTCQGQNPFADKMDAITTLTANVTVSVNKVINEVITNLENLSNNNITAPNGTETCITDLHALSAKLNQSEVVVADLLESFQCSQINPIYIGVVNEALCKGVVAGLGTMWITMALGASALMAAMIVYRIFKFGQYSNGDWQDPHVTNGAVLANGEKAYI